MTRRRLPIGIQTFREIRERDCYYVDKTAYIRRLLDEGNRYFLSRPRRFGKSLFLDTCKQLFEGNEALFEGLAIHGRWDWSVRHPVVHLSFGSGHFQGPDDLRTEVMDRLEVVEREAAVTARHASASARLAHVIRTLHQRTGQRNDIARFEGYYASVFYSYFAGLGLDVTVEDSTSHGRLDMAVRFNGNVYLFEFKVVEMAPEGAAMAQLKEKRYADKYRDAGVPIHLVAVEFSKDARNVVAFDIEPG